MWFFTPDIIIPIVIISFFILMIALSSASSLISDAFLRKKLAAKGKLLPWDIFEKNIKDGNGTVIINKTNLPGRLYWASETINDHFDATSSILSGRAFLVKCPAFKRITENKLKELGAKNIVIPRTSIRHSQTS